jgi:hypothetical protein
MMEKAVKLRYSLLIDIHWLGANCPCNVLSRHGN